MIEQMFYLSRGAVGYDRWVTDQPRGPESGSNGQPPTSDQPGSQPPSPPPSAPGDVPAPPPSQPLPPPPPAAPGPPPAAPPGPPPPPPDSPTVVGMPPPPPTFPGAPPPGPQPSYPAAPPNYQGPPTGPPPGYQVPPPSGGGSNGLIVGFLILLLILVVGGGGMFVMGIGLFAPGASPTLVARPTSEPSLDPTASATATAAPTPTTTATPAMTDAPTVEPSTAPSAAPTEGTSPIPSGVVVAQLLSHVPEAVAESCFTTPGTAPISALAVCTADAEAIEVTYFLYDSQQAMFQAYEGFRLISGIEPGTGSCSDAATWPTEKQYTIGEQPAGRWLCTEALGETTIYWTDDRMNILSQATHTTADYARLVEFWVNESGPFL